MQLPPIKKPAQKKGGCKKHRRAWPEWKKASAKIKAGERKDRNVLRSSHGVFASVADMRAGQRRTPNEIADYRNPRRSSHARKRATA